MKWLVVAVAGGLGALLRAELSARLGRGIGTAVVNIVGAAALGVLAALLGRVHPTVALVAGTGFLGGLTTFSTWMVESVDAGQRRGVLLVLVQLAAGLAGAGVAAVAI